MKRTGAAAGFANVRTVPAAEDDPLLPEPVDLDSVEDNFFVIYSCPSCGDAGSETRIEGSAVDSRRVRQQDTQRP